MKVAERPSVAPAVTVRMQPEMADPFLVTVKTASVPAGATAVGNPARVIEAKTPVRASQSWFDAAVQIYEDYERNIPELFAPNVLSIATEGKEFRYGAIRQPPEMWLPWSKTTEPLALPGLDAVLRSAALLLRPEVLLDVEF